MIQSPSKLYSRSIIMVAMLLITSTVSSACKASSYEADTGTITPPTETPITESITQDSEIDELAGIPDISMDDLAQSMDAETLYIDNCAKCHGLTGLGDGPSVGSLNTQHGLNLRILGDLSKDELRQIISVGKGMEMPPWELLLSQQQLEAITDYVRTLSDP